MASTYSPNLRIELIATGEQSNTWGVTTNSNLGTLIEQAISGVVSVSVTAGDVTLTALNGATDQSRQMVIIATGTPGVARVITAPAVGKVYVVHNNSDASLSFIASGGTGVTLIVGAKKYIYCDGTNFYEAINALTVTSGTIDGATIGATTATTGKFTTVQSTVTTGTAPFIVASTTVVANLTAATANALTTTNNYQMASLGVGVAASGVSGEIRATGPITVYSTSDKRLKENIKPIENALEKISQINGVNFDWADEEIERRGGVDGYFVRKHDVGVIAQEIEKVVPEAVATRENGHKAVRYEILVPLLIEAIKEQQQQINDLKKRIK